MKETEVKHDVTLVAELRKAIKVLQETSLYWKRRAELWERLYQLRDDPDPTERDEIWEELKEFD